MNKDTHKFGSRRKRRKYSFSLQTFFLYFPWSQTSIQRARLKTDSLISGAPRYLSTNFSSPQAKKEKVTCKSVPMNQPDLCISGLYSNQLMPTSKHLLNEYGGKKHTEGRGSSKCRSRGRSVVCEEVATYLHKIVMS